MSVHTLLDDIDHCQFRFDVLKVGNLARINMRKFQWSKKRKKTAGNPSLLRSEISPDGQVSSHLESKVKEK